MNAATLESPTGKFRQLLLVTLLIFLLQLALIYLLSSRGNAPSPRSTARSTSVRLSSERLTETQFSQNFLGDDPTLFASANSHGFSGPAWLKSPPQEYDKIDFAERAEAFWLPLNVKRFGDGVSRFVETNVAALIPIAEGSVPPIRVAAIPVETKQRSESRLRIEGDLASREVINFPQLHPWAHSNLLNNSVVQVSVDKSGVVLSPRLLSRSGLALADNAALQWASTIQFSRDDKNEITWGKLVFDWHTIATTNSEVKVTAP